MFNVTEPFEPISVGPIFQISISPYHLRHPDGCKSCADRSIGNMPEVTVNYVLSMSPLEKSDYDEEAPQKVTHPAVLPDHFFWDDEAILSFGHGDREMYTTAIPVSEMMGRQKLCSSLVA